MNRICSQPATATTKNKHIPFNINMMASTRPREGRKEGSRKGGKKGKREGKEGETRGVVAK